MITQQATVENLSAALPFIYHDGGRSQSKRPKQKNDCTVRAIALTMERSYDEVYEDLAKHGRRSGGKYLVDPYLDKMGFNQATFPAKAGCRRLQLQDFIQQHSTGWYIVKTAKHVFALKDGVMYDTYRVQNFRTVYKAWKIR